MSKIVFFCIPAHGHTNPTLEVVKELISRGHEVWYYSYNVMCEKIEEAGATFISCDDFDTEKKLSPNCCLMIRFAARWQFLNLIVLWQIQWRCGEKLLR